MQNFSWLSKIVYSKPRLSLSLILKVTYTSQIVLAVGLTGWFSLRNGCLAVHQSALDLRKETASQVSQHIKGQLTTTQQIIQANLAAIKLGMLPLDSFELIGQYVWQKMQIYNVGYINFAHKQGEFIGVKKAKNNQFLINETRAPALDQMSIFEIDSQGDLTQSVFVSALPSDWLNQLEQVALKGSDSILEELVEESPPEYSIW